MQLSLVITKQGCVDFAGKIIGIIGRQKQRGENDGIIGENVGIIGENLSKLNYA